MALAKEPLSDLRPIRFPYLLAARAVAPPVTSAISMSATPSRRMAPPYTRFSERGDQSDPTV